MRFTSVMALFASAAVTSAGKLTLWPLDHHSRTVYFTANPGHDEIAPVTVCQKNVTVVLPEVWVGNYYAVKEGEPNVPGMLGEINFSSWGDLTYFDVSAIVAPHDHDNVQQIWPTETYTPMSGCDVWPCMNAYWHPDDTQTKTTDKTDLTCTLGTGVTGLTFAELQ